MYIVRNDDGTWSEPLSMRSMWRGVWDWHKLTDAQRAEYGWYPLREVAATFDPRTQTRTGPTFDLGGDGVVTATYVVTYDATLATQSINVERDRRIATPFTFEGHPYQSDDESRQRIDKSRGSAMAAVMGGAQPGDLRWTGVDVDFFWIALDDTRVTMDAQTMIRLGNASAAREGLLIVAANDLKRRVASGEVIANVGDDALWP